LEAWCVELGDDCVRGPFGDLGLSALVLILSALVHVLH
jgi:hypothetical protein